MGMTNTGDATTCPSCGERLVAVSLGGRSTSRRPGEYALCMNCGAALQYSADLTPRALTSGDEMDPDKRAMFTALQAAIRRARQHSGTEEAE